MGDLSDIETEKIIAAHLAGASLTKTDTFGASRETVSKVMSAYTNHGKTISAKNSGQISTLIERDCHTLRKITQLLQHR
jgi:deoxyribose-phosphate aldolase